MLICGGRTAAALAIAFKRAFAAAFALLKAVAFFETLAFFEALLKAFAATGAFTSSSATATTRSAATGRTAGLTHLDAAAGLEPQLAFGYHGLTRVQTAGDHHVFSHTGRCGHGASFDGPVFLYDVNELAILTVLDCRVGDCNCTRLDGQP
jgi:hypothetical protein